MASKLDQNRAEVKGDKKMVNHFHFENIFLWAKLKHIFFTCVNSILPKIQFQV